MDMYGFDGCTVTSKDIGRIPYSVISLISKPFMKTVDILGLSTILFIRKTTLPLQDITLINPILYTRAPLPTAFRICKRVLGYLIFKKTTKYFNLKKKKKRENT
jgi:hypothetical protein